MTGKRVKPPLSHGRADPEREQIKRDLYKALGELPKVSMTSLLDDPRYAEYRPTERKILLPTVEKANMWRKEGLSENALKFLTTLRPEYRERVAMAFLNLHSEVEEAAVMEAVWEYIQFGDPEKCNVYFTADYAEPVCDMEEFIESPQFLGLRGSIYPMLKNDLCEFFDPDKNYNEGIFTGGIGWGKTFIDAVCLARMCYELGCIRNPHNFHHLDPTSTITLICMSVSLQQAMRAIYKETREKIVHSEWFKQKFCPNLNIETELRFPKNVLLIATTNPIGYNVYGGVIDEINFLPMVKESKRIRSRSINTDVYDHAQVIYNALSRRHKTRFQKYGRSFGKLILSSSKQYPDDFLERKIREAKNDPSVFVLDYPEWVPKPADSYCGQTFRVVVGDMLHGSRILEAEEPEPKGLKVVEVPIEYQPEFQRDPESAIRDIAGISVLALEPFMTQRQFIYEAVMPAMRHPIVNQQGDSITTAVYMDGLYISAEAFKHWDKRHLRYAHIDLALRHDACGLVVGHIVGEKQVDRFVAGEEHEEVQPVIKTDLILQIKAPPGGEIHIPSVRSILYELRNRGIQFGKVTFDQFQSAESIQELNRRGIPADQRSVEGMEPYQNLKFAFYERRIRMYHHPVLIKELTELEHNKKKNKVDHRPSGSKDVADALCGMYNNALEGHYSSRGIIDFGQRGRPDTYTPHGIKDKDLAMIVGSDEEIDDMEYFQ